MKININLKEMRLEKGLTQKELAKLAKVSISNITQIEQKINKNPYILSLLKIAKALGVSIYDLIEIEED